jgi:thermitase
MKTWRANIRWFFSTMTFCFVLVIAPWSLIAQSGAYPQSPFAQDRILVAFNPGTAASDIRSAHSRAGGKVIKTISAIGVEVVAVPAGKVLSTIQQYRLNPNVKFAEPNYQRPLFRPVTNEGSEPVLGISNNFEEQWGLHNEGQSFGATIDPIWGTLIFPAYSGTADADIDAPEGWNLSTGSTDINIAILDSGVSCAHVDLDSKCIEQVNFVGEHGSSVSDVIGHGTHVAAIAAAETDNGIGTAGVAQQASIGSLKVCYEDYSLAILGIIQGVCEDADIAEAIVYAADHGYHVINMSLAGPQDSAALQDAVNYAWSNGVVIVAAAGNDYGAGRSYPAAYENVIAVAATDYYDNLAYFSNFSTDSDDWVSVAAPGHTILSAVPGAQCGVAANDPLGCYDWKTGTSMAAPYVSGIAALLWSYLETPDNMQIRSNIENSADRVGALGKNRRAWTKNGRVNLFRALSSQFDDPGGDTTPPVISGISTSTLHGPVFEVSWQTDEPSDSVMFVNGDEVRDDRMVMNHVLEYRGKKGVTYDCYVSSTDAAGNTAVSASFPHQN